MAQSISSLALACATVALLGAGPTSQPASQPASGEITKLIAELGAADFKTREAAHRRLEALGDSASAELIEHVADSNEEIANRVVAILGKPKDPAVRVELAVRLLETADPDWMEKGVYLLFDSPEEVIDLYFRRTKGAHGLQRMIFEIVGQQLRSWKKMNDIFQDNYERIRRKNPEAAERLRQSNGIPTCTMPRRYWSAVEVVAIIAILSERIGVIAAGEALKSRGENRKKSVRRLPRRSRYESTISVRPGRGRACALPKRMISGYPPASSWRIVRVRLRPLPGWCGPRRLVRSMADL
jgi:hypothetical protein